MPHFLIKKEYISGEIIKISNKEALAHLTGALRIQIGENVKFIDTDETLYSCAVQSVSKGELTARILSREKSERKLDFSLCAAICVLKPDGMALAIQNAVQLGAKEIYAVYSDNSAPKRESLTGRKEKWEKYAYEAFKQCERADLPKIAGLVSFDEIFSKFKKENIIIFAEKYDEFSLERALFDVNFDEKILAVFGPEGGFSENEFLKFKELGLKLTTLGKLILKAPNAVTAGLFGIAQHER